MPQAASTFTIGSLVRTRGREWVVLPESSDDLLVLRPLGGADRETAGIYLPLECDDVTPATFDLPSTAPSDMGDFQSCQLLRDAVRLSFRAGAGPFRSFGRMSVEPRPYQLVPLLMALKLNPVRLLIADDVGIGKTVEACLIAKELMDRGEIQRLAVLCPPHLAEQWQKELSDKFHIEAELVLPSTIARLERNLGANQSLFDLHPFVVVSTDFIKSDRYRSEFTNRCPEFVIVDEAHTVAYSAEGNRSKHQRHQLVARLAQDATRHLVLVTATPHSGDETAFRSLLGLLKREFADLPADLSGATHEKERRALALHLVQRRRADIREYMRAATPFPLREEKEESYALGDDYRSLFQTALNYARERVQDKTIGKRQQRVRWWSVLALLRSLASSPAAAAATLRARSLTVEAGDEAAVDRVGERTVLDLDDADAEEYPDLIPGSLDEGEEGAGGSEREQLLTMARRAEKLRGPEFDTKLKKAITLIRSLLNDGYNPIVFCRFIATAEYLAEQLRAALPRTVAVQAVTGTLPPVEREQRVIELGAKEKRVLVATDCLSEGVNLQEHFDAVLHYDLSWNPTRHEQREGRVDRYGQKTPAVRTITFFGADNQIDGVVLEVLLRKHKSIRNSLGISVPVPGKTNDVVQALMQGVILRGRAAGGSQKSFFDLDESFASELYEDLHKEWEDASSKERRSRTVFAQQSIKVETVEAEWKATSAAIGTGVDVERFVRCAVELHGGSASAQGRVVRLNLPAAPALREIFRDNGALRANLDAVFELPVPDGAELLTRMHPAVEELATWVVSSVLDPHLEGAARRAGVLRTRAVKTRTTLLLLRLRHHIVNTRRGGAENTLLAEEALLLGFEGAPESAIWLPPAEAEALLAAQPHGNMHPQQAADFVQQVVDGFPHLTPHLAGFADERAQDLLYAHRDVRADAGLTNIRTDVRPQLPVDVLGIYVLLPMPVL